MIRHADSQLFYKDTVHKDWQILIVEDNMTLGNADILVDELTIEESLCSEEEITLGACVASKLEFKMFNKGVTMKGKTLRVTLVLNGHTSNPVPIGVYKVDEDTIEEDERIRDITAYDALYEILEKDFAPWFNNLPSGQSILLKDFRDSFMEYAGIQQEEVNLINDWVPFTFVVTNSLHTQKMVDEENEKIRQMTEDAEKGVELYRYDLIDLNTYDPTKKTHTLEYTKVENVQKTDDPAARGWYYFDPRIEDYKASTSHTVTISLRNIAAIVTYDPDTRNPHDLGWYEDTNDDPYSTKLDLELTEDTSVEKDKIYYTATEVIQPYFEKHETNDFDPWALNWYVPIGSKTYKRSEDRTTQYQTAYYEQIAYKIEPPTYKEVIGVKETDNPNEKSWYEYDSINQKYKKSQDLVADLTKTYYEQCLPENRASAMLRLDLSYHSGQNPKEKGWYEKPDPPQDAYIKTEDETINYNKVYYINIWEIDQNDEVDIIEDVIKGSEIITAICEINGCFGHIDRNGVFRYVKLKPIDYEAEGLYPDPELYPDPNLYPAGQPADQECTRGIYETCEKESYIVKKLDRLVICKEDGDTGYVYPANSYPEDHNTYKITGNFIWYSFTENQETLNIVGNNLLINGIAQISEYTPCTIDMMGNPCIEVGDTLKVITRLGTFYTYVLTRTINGSQRLRDSVEAKGNEERQNEHSIYDSIIELKGKSNILTRNVDMTRNEIVDMGEHLTSLFEQTAESIKFEVSKEVVDTNNQVTEKYQSSIKYTDQLISQVVSKTAYNADKEELETWQAGINVSFNNVTAEVTNTVKKTGEKNGFKWSLTEDGFILSACGQYRKLNLNPVGDLIPVTDTTGKNPFLEQWHELIDDSYYELTSDTTPDPSKTYYRSRINPKESNYYDTVTGTYALTEDENIHTHKTYYEKGGSSQWEEVFICDPRGVQINGYLSTEYLDVNSYATFQELRATNVIVDNISVRSNVLAQQIGDLNARVEAIYTQYLDADYIKSIVVNTAGLNAENITTGSLSADRITFTDKRISLRDGSLILGSNGIVSGGALNPTKLFVKENPDTSGNSWFQIAGHNIVRKSVTVNGQSIKYLAWMD